MTERGHPRQEGDAEEEEERTTTRKEEEEAELRTKEKTRCMRIRGRTQEGRRREGRWRWPQ